MKINKTNYIYLIITLGIQIYISYSISCLTMKAYHLMNMFELAYQIIIETNILLASFFICNLLNNSIKTIKEHLAKTCFIALLSISPSLYIGFIKINNHLSYLSILLIIQIIFILATYKKNINLNIVYCFISLLLTSLFTFIIAKDQYEEIITVCEITSNDKKMEQCIYWLNSSQYNNGEGFLNGIKAIEVMNKNNQFKKYLEHKYSAKANIEENRIYWEPIE